MQSNSNNPRSPALNSNGRHQAPENPITRFSKSLSSLFEMASCLHNHIITLVLLRDFLLLREQHLDYSEHLGQCFFWKKASFNAHRLPWVVKLKSAGFSRPFGNLTFGSRSSSKKECAQASRGVRRAVGVYSSRRLHSAIASGGVRGRKT